MPPHMRLSLNPSLADLVAAGVRPRAADAATIARELALRAARGELPGIPSFHVIRLADDGTIHVEGPVASGREIERAARLLETMLPPMDAQTDVRVPGALRLTIARALRVLDLPPFASLEAFAEALDRFVVQDSGTVVMSLVGAWRAAVTDEPSQALAIDAPLTISDIRRARRATRLTLADISERSKIPFALLRQFEWGYLANWPSGFTGRAQVVRYARAAGLDERIVLGVAVPLLDEFEAPSAVEREAPITVTDVPVPTSIVHVEPSPLVVAHPPRRRARWGTRSPFRRCSRSASFRRSGSRPAISPKRPRHRRSCSLRRRHPVRQQFRRRPSPRQRPSLLCRSRPHRSLPPLRRPGRRCSTTRAADPAVRSSGPTPTPVARCYE